MGSRISVQAPYGKLVHEIRLSRDGNMWSARIVTLPRQIWVEPGGRKAMTFRADTPERAQDLAIDFVHKDCIARGHRLIDPSREKGALTDLPARRLPVEYPIRIIQKGILAGRGTVTRRALTTNLSESGLFIATSEPFFPGSHVAIDLSLPGTSERLEGVVVWSRMADQYGRRAGMGVRLLEPSLSYRSRIQSLDGPTSLTL